MQAQISLRISAGWSGPTLSTYRISGYCTICRRAENAQIRLHGCACWSGPTLSANCIKVFFVRCPSDILFDDCLESDTFSSTRRQCDFSGSWKLTAVLVGCRFLTPSDLCALSEDSDQPMHSYSVISLCCCMFKYWLRDYQQRTNKDWTNCKNAQANHIRHSAQIF